MTQRLEGGRLQETLMALLLIAFFLLASPFFAWWASLRGYWYMPYVFWLIIVFLACLLQIRRHDL